jgi:Protein of unknown function (DUF3293)
MRQSIGKTVKVLITPEHLRQTFLHSVIRIEVGQSYLGASEALERLPQPIFVLTATNPNRRVLDGPENDARNEALRRDLLDRGAVVYSAIGASPDGSWEEKSWAVVGMGRRAARKLGKTWEQEAIFELRGDRQIVLGCFSTWECSRPLREERHSEASGPDLVTAVRDALRIQVTADFTRADWPGWSHDGDLGLPCQNCSAPLHLFGADLVSKAGAPYRSTIFVCPKESIALLPNLVPKAYLVVAKRWRDYRLAARDADALERGDRAYHAYVIELNDEIEKPPEATQPWVYVGQSSATPEERFSQHRRGYKSSKWPRKYGVKLRPDLYEDQPALRTQDEALAYEAWLAAYLQALGYPVKGGH